MTQSFDPTQFLSVARELAAQPYSQARFRTAVGRAYYAVFLVAREKTRVRSIQGVHDDVIDALERAGKEDVAELMKELKRLRAEADYQMKPDYRAYADWRKVWSRASRIVEEVLPDLEAMRPLTSRT